MKVARFFAVIFAVAGIVLMLGSTVICFASMNSSVKILEYPDDAVACSDDLCAALTAGDYAAMETLLYGQPSLGADAVPGDVCTEKLWEAFRTGIHFEYTSKLYLLDADLARDAQISVLDVAAITAQLETRVKALLEEKARTAEDPSTVLDADGGYLPQVVEEALPEALDQLLAGDPPRSTRNVTVKLIRRDDRWWAVPDQAFWKAISGLEA